MSPGASRPRRTSTAAAASGDREDSIRGQPGGPGARGDPLGRATGSSVHDDQQVQRLARRLADLAMARSWAVPSSRISPSTATRRPGSPASSSRAARTDPGAAL